MKIFLIEILKSLLRILRDVFICTYFILTNYFNCLLFFRNEQVFGSTAIETR